MRTTSMRILGDSYNEIDFIYSLLRPVQLEMGEDCARLPAYGLLLPQPLFPKQSNVF